MHISLRLRSETSFYDTRVKFKGHVQVITSRYRLLISRQNSILAFHGNSLATLSCLYFHANPAFLFWNIAQERRIRQDFAIISEAKLPF